MYSNFQKPQGYKNVNASTFVKVENKSNYNLYHKILQLLNSIPTYTSQ